MGKATPWYIQQSPQIGQAFQDFNDASVQEGVVDAKTKALVQLAVSCVMRCTYCTETHIEGAEQAGASKREISEILLLTAAQCAGTQLAWHKDYFVPELSKRADED